MRECFHFKNGKYLSFKTPSHCCCFFSHLYVIKFTNKQIDKSDAIFHLENNPRNVNVSKVTYTTIELYIIITYLTHLLVYNLACKSKANLDVWIFYFVKRTKTDFYSNQSFISN